MIINDLGGSPIKSDNDYFANNEQESLHNLTKLKLYNNWSAEAVNNISECAMWYLMSESHLPKNICVICFIDSPLKMMKNAYFIIEALFVLKIFKFLSWLFGHAWKMAWLER